MSVTFPYPACTMLPVIGLSILAVPTIGIAMYDVPSTSSVAIRLVVKLLYVAPTVTDPKFLPGLPIVSVSGPSLPAAVTTNIFSCSA